MERAVLEGVWSFYNDVIAQNEGTLLKAWEQNPDKEIKHQLWMEITNLRKAQASIKKFAEQTLKKSFGSMRELEIVECIALIYETMYENEIIRKYFDFDKRHKATIKQATNGYVQLAINVSKQDDESMPSVTEDSRFAIRKVKLTPPDAEKDNSGDKVEDVRGERMFPPENAAESEPEEEPVLPTFTLTGEEFKGRCINVAAEGDFVVSFFISDKDARKNFVEGECIDVALKMARNPIPTRRMLKAIGRVSKEPGKRDTWRFKAMQKFLKGAGNPDTDQETLGSLKEECFSRMNEREKDIFNKYVASCKLNSPQAAVWKHIFDFRNFVTMLQGPPGTGKTRTVATIAMSYVLLKCKTALCAPSNTAVEECMKNVVQNLNLLRTIDPKAADDFLVVLLPTTASTKASLKNLGDEHAAHDFVAEGEGAESDPYREYRLHSHIVRLMQSKVALKTADHGMAQNWLDILNKLKTKQTVKRKDLREFVDQGILESANVLKDPRVRLVLSTSSNADLMHEYGYKPVGVIIDEAAYSSEPESMIPLSLGARSNVIVGDHEQLKPFVRSRGHNEFARQLGLSIYERFYGHHSIPLFRLKINYRMHPDIAQLPGMLTYEWLGCDPATNAPTEAYNFFHDWFENGDGHSWDANTRAPAFGGPADRDCRVRWVNTKDSFASANPGSTSLRNFANIKEAAQLVISLLRHVPTEGIPDLPGSSITLLSPYKEDLEELKKQLGFGIKFELSPNFLNIPLVQTIDKMQGGQNEIVILLIPPHHCALLGFMREFHRWNVAMTRANSVFWIIGNLDGLRSQLKVLSKGMRCKKLALTIIDYLDRGQVIDVAQPATLPASYEECILNALPAWTNVQNQPHAQDLKLKDVHQHLQNAYDATEQQRYEAELLEELKKLRSKAADLQIRFLNGEVFDLPLQTKLQDEGNEDDEGADAEMDDAEEDNEEDPEVPSPTTDGKGKGQEVEPEGTRTEDDDRLDPYLQSQIDEATRLSLEMGFGEAIKRSKADLRQKSKPGEASGSGGSGGDLDTEMVTGEFLPLADTLQTSFAKYDLLEAMNLQGASAAAIQADAEEEEELRYESELGAKKSDELFLSGDEND